MTRTDPVPPPEQPKSDSENRLNALWADMLFDACASDGPIRLNDVREAIKRGRPKIEAEARAAERRAVVERTGIRITSEQIRAALDALGPTGDRAEAYVKVAALAMADILDAVATDTPEEPER
jgi:hypothetical protein